MTKQEFKRQNIDWFVERFGKLSAIHGKQINRWNRNETHNAMIHFFRIEDWHMNFDEYCYRIGG